METVWITGAGAGLGRALALRYARDGATVAASARTMTDLQSLAVEAQALGGSAVTFPLDVTDRAAVAPAADAIERSVGPLDL